MQAHVLSDWPAWTMAQKARPSAGSAAASGPANTCEEKQQSARRNSKDAHSRLSAGRTCECGPDGHCSHPGRIAASWNQIEGMSTATEGSVTEQRIEGQRPHVCCTRSSSCRSTNMNGDRNADGNEMEARLHSIEYFSFGLILSFVWFVSCRVFSSGQHERAHRLSTK